MQAVPAYNATISNTGAMPMLGVQMLPTAEQVSMPFSLFQSASIIMMQI